MRPGRFPHHRPWCRGLAVGFLVWAARPYALLSDSPQPDPTEPRWMRFQFDHLAAGLDVESESEGWRGRRATADAGTLTRDRLHLSPVLEIGGRGSIYHPNLLTYDLRTESLLTYDEFDLSGSPDPAAQRGQSSLDPAMRYQLNARILEDRPYAAHVHASRGRSYRDVDFFTRTILDSEGYGANVGYRDGPVPVSISYDRRSESEAGTARPSSTDEELVAVQAHHSRAGGGETQLAWSHQEFDRRNLGYARDLGTSRQLDLSDTERLGNGDWILLRSSFRYGLVDSTGRDDEDLRFVESLSLRHSDELQSSAQYGFSQRTSGSPSGSTSHTGHHGGVGVQHQWFESLTSSLDLRGESDSTRSESGRLEVLRYGARLTEAYTKRLGSRARLHLGYSFLAQPEERSFDTGDVTVLDESHSLRDSNVALLALPNIDPGSIRVTDASGTVLYLQGLDYTVLPRGAMTELRRVAGSHIPDGAAVLVSYVARSQASDRYTSLVNALQWRLDLFGRLISLYARLTFDQKPGGNSPVLNEYVDAVAGIESEWRWFHAGAEYEDYDSTLTPYQAIRFRESVTWQPTSEATLGLSLSQTFTEFPDSRRQVDYQDFVARVEIRPSRALTLKFEGGYRLEQGEGVDQSVFTARADVSYTLGRFAALLGYQYQDESYFSDSYFKHYLFAKVRRSF